MLMPILDKLLGYILVESISDEALGDLWEAHYRLVVEEKPVFFRSLVTLWRALLLVCASIQVANEDRKRQKRDTSLTMRLLSKLPHIIATLMVSVAGLAVIALVVLHPLWIEDISCLLPLFQIDLLILGFTIVACATGVGLSVGPQMFVCAMNATKEALEI
jgi:Ca2+/Na+ antiporter